MKKVFSVCLALVLLLACISVQASAEDTPTFAAGNVEALPGETVEIPILIENNPGIVALSVNVSFDGNVLELQNASATGSVFPAEGITFGGTYNTDSFNIIWYDATSTANYTDSGLIATLTFLVKEDAPIGETSISVSYARSSVVDVNLDEVTFDTRNGVINVVSPEVGGWSFTEGDNTLFIYEGGSGVNFVCGLDSFSPVVSDFIETTGGWTSDVELNEYGMESTGAKLVIYDENANVVEEYYTVLFGDVSGDGNFDLSDVSMQMDVLGGLITDTWMDFLDSDEYAQSFAADISHDLNLDLTDVGLILDQLSGVEIDQTQWF